jgi:hypothetical protein
MLLAEHDIFSRDNVSHDLQWSRTKQDGYRPTEMTFRSISCPEDVTVQSNHASQNEVELLRGIYKEWCCRQRMSG